MQTGQEAKLGRAPSALTSALCGGGWWTPLLIWGLSRLYSTALLGNVFTVATAAGWPFPSRRTNPTFFTFSGSWDGWFYRSIAEHGYPSIPPVDALGFVLPNPWAFLPVFPALEHVVTALTGITTYTAGTLIAVTAGGGATIALHRLLVPQVGPRRAAAAVALFCFGPTGFLLQVAYAESLFLLLAFAALLTLQQQRWTAFAVLGATASLTRPGGAALVIALLLQLRAGLERRPARLAAPIVAGLVVGVAAIAWPFVADAVTEEQSVYLRTELAWWTGWVGRPAFIPFTPWALITLRWLGVGGLLGAAAVIAAITVWFIRGGPRSLDPATRGFTGGYLLYLLAVFLPQVSLPRLLLPAAPLLATTTFTGAPRRTRAWLIAATASQPPAVVLLWFLGYP